MCKSAPRNICFAVDAVSDGASAVEKLKGSDGTMYDLILMDIQMPGMNGHIAKPVEIPKLLNMLGKILG